ncbi:MAG: Rpn family recombination-promoting nuclease/putative transposase [Polyangiaceae bacterium]|nr:Rpn family recombination-promoting nuclease/putative transposase [Polyangiaceae bacterium]
MPEQPLLSPTIDLVFKLLFGDEERKPILIALLTAILQPESPIVDVVLLETSSISKAVNDKTIVLDILVKLQNGSMIDIEMQVLRTPEFRSRVMYYWARTHTGQIYRGDKYGKLRPTTVVVITNYLELGTGFLHSVFQVLEKHDGSRFSDDFELHFVELPRIKDPAILAAAPPALQRWARFLGSVSDDERAEVAKEDPMIDQAMVALRSLSANPETRSAAMSREEALMLYQMDIDAANEKGIEKGRMQSLADAVLCVLTTRGANVTQQLRGVVEGCGDVARFQRWLVQASTMNAGDVFHAD